MCLSIFSEDDEGGEEYEAVKSFTMLNVKEALIRCVCRG
jgi:hypothetical protein